MIFDRTGKITLLFDICLNQGSLVGWIRAGGGVPEGWVGVSFLLAPAKKMSILIISNENLGKYIAFDSCS